MVGFSYLSVRNAFLSSPWTVLSIKYKLDCEHSFARKSVSESISAAKSRKLRGRESLFSLVFAPSQLARLRCSNTLADRFSSKRETARRINTGWELKALLFRSMGRCESSFDMTACQALVQSQFQKKKDWINQSMSLFASVVARSQWGKTQKFRMWRGREHYGWNIKKLRCLQWRVWTCLYCIDRTVKLYNLAQKGPYVLQNCFFFATRYTLTRQNKAQ